MNYYNEIDPFAAEWLRQLIDSGMIPRGDVDERSIEDVFPDDLTGYNQCHFFAGIGGCAYALRLAGWPDDRPVWTGSCPCQPFSQAGQRAGFDDERHLWPSWYWLIQQQKPDIIFGEQVANGADQWFELISNDLEAEDYAVGSVDLPACSIGAPHLRQRRWFVAESTGERLEKRKIQQRKQQQAVERGCYVGGMADTGFVADSNSSRSQSRGETIKASRHWNPFDSGDWEWLPNRDGKWRPTQSGIYPLAHGVSARVGRLRGYGNAIVPQVAAEVIKAYIDIRSR